MIKMAPDVGSSTTKYRAVKDDDTFSGYHLFFLFPLISENSENVSAKKGLTFEIPSGFDNFTNVAEQLKSYKTDHSIYITILFICVYLYKQTFAIPGSFLLVSEI